MVFNFFSDFSRAKCLKTLYEENLVEYYDYENALDRHVFVEIEEMFRVR